MRAIAREVQPDDTVVDVERSRAQIDVLVHEAQLPEGAEDLGDPVQGNGRIDRIGTLGIGETGARISEILVVEDTEPKGVVDQPEGGARAGEMQLAVEDAVRGDQLDDEREDLVDMSVHQALDALLIEQTSANRRIAFELEPLLRLLVELAGERKLAQIEVGTEIAQQRALLVLDPLDGGERWTPGVAADVDGGQRKALAGECVEHVGPFAPVPTPMLRQQALRGDVRGQLAGVAVEDVEIFAGCERRQCRKQDPLQRGAIRPGRATRLDQPRQRCRQATLQEDTLTCDDRFERLAHRLDLPVRVKGGFYPESAGWAGRT